MVPSGSEEPEALAVTESGAVPEDGVTVRLATGGWLAAVTVTVLEAVPVAPALAVTASGAVPDEGVTVRLATGGWLGGLVPWNSSAPRSAYVTGPSPVLGVAASSLRALPSASCAGQLATPELASSIAGE